jgi:hypothetical protein
MSSIGCGIPTTASPQTPTPMCCPTTHIAPLRTPPHTSYADITHTSTSEIDRSKREVRRCIPRRQGKARLPPHRFLLSAGWELLLDGEIFFKRSAYANATPTRTLSNLDQSF